MKPASCDGFPWHRSTGLVLVLCLLPAALLMVEQLLEAVKGEPRWWIEGLTNNNLTFNSMLLHLLRGRFDIDPTIIGNEGLVREGVTYAYFGIAPALFRLPFLPLRNFAAIDFTPLECAFAVSLMTLFKILSVRTVWRASDQRGPVLLLILFIASIIAGGAQVQFLRPSVYQEVCLWAGVCAAAFVYWTLRGYYSERGFTPGLLLALATASGLCLLTRVSTALGLYIAFGLIWLQPAWHALRSAGPSRLGRGWRIASLLPSALMLVAFVVAAALINYKRWGNPLLFSDYDRYLWAIRLEPKWLDRVHQYGEFNFIRMGYGLMYYMFPAFVLRGSDGNLLWSQFRDRTINAAELPPSSFLFSDPLLVGLAGYALVRLVFYRDIPRSAIVIAALTGLLVPAVLMLMAVYMAFRYRMEFYPCLEFCALIGFSHILTAPSRWAKTFFAVAVPWGTVASVLLLLLYSVSPGGSADRAMNGASIVSYYVLRTPLLHRLLSR